MNDETASIDIHGARGYAIPMTARFRGITIREGMLIEGPAGWGEFCPFRQYDDREAASWLATAVEAATVGWPEPIRDRVPINCTVPAVGPQRAHEIVSASGCATAKVKEYPSALRGPVQVHDHEHPFTRVSSRGLPVSAVISPASSSIRRVSQDNSRRLRSVNPVGRTRP